MTEQRRCVANSVQRRPKRAGVRNALAKLARILPPTPRLSLDVDGRTICCKAECLQPIGAFKIRGAWHRLTELDDRQRAAGVVAFSSGNHAQGVAWAARRLAIRAAIVMPSDAPQAKLEATRSLGAEIILYDRNRESREEIAERLADERGATLVPSFADPWIIEGQGVSPDIAVTDDPAELAKGNDPQLDRAISEMMEAIKANPPASPKRPAYPNRAGLAAGGERP